MLKPRGIEKLALHKETVRALNSDDLRNVVGGGGLPSKQPSCSTDGYVCQTDSIGYTCRDCYDTDNPYVCTI